MHILLLCWRDTGHPQGGGSERYLEHVASYLAAHGHHVELRTALYPGAPTHEKKSISCSPTSPYFTIRRAGNRYTVYTRAAWDLLRARFHRGPYSTITACIDSHNGIPFFAGPLSGKPTLILTHHCHREQWPVAGPFLARIGWFIEGWLSPRIHHAHNYVTVSEPSRNDLLALGIDARRIHIVYNGIDPLPAPSSPIDAPTSPLHLVTLSRLVPHKRIEHAIATLAALHASTSNVRYHLDIIGSGWWEEKLKNYAVVMGVEKNITFHGYVSETRKHELLERAALHLLPSIKEGWGLSVMEAAQHGVPTVGYRTSGGLEETIIDGRTGLLASTWEEFTRATHHLLENEALRTQLGHAARARAAHYSWDETGRAIEALLNALTDSNGAALHYTQHTAD